MYTQSSRAERVHIRKTTSGNGITLCAIATPSAMQKAALLVLLHNLIPQSNLTPLPINSTELTPCSMTKLNTTSQSYRLCYISRQ